MRDYTALMMPACFARFFAAGTVFAAVLFSREIPLKEGSAQYLAHADVEKHATIGADFLGRYLPIPGTTVYSDEYLFVEVAFFGAKGITVEFKPDQFWLVVNGATLTAQPPGVVTLWNGALEMSPRPQVVGGTVNGGTIEVGGSPRTPRFPGDDPAHTPRDPVPQVPVDPSNGQVKKTQTPEEAVRSAVLPQGTHALPIGGYLFFAYEGKLKKIKHAELHYKGPLGEATLKLR